MLYKTSEFNIRVYGLVINEKQEILLSDEFRIGMFMTKFPGGGLEKGEGTIDCLRREFMEELNQPIKNIQHFYTTDFYQEGWFYKNTQLISIYYSVDIESSIRFEISKNSFNFEKSSSNPQSFRWEKIKTLTTKDLTFPIDKKVLEILKKK